MRHPSTVERVVALLLVALLVTLARAGVAAAYEPPPIQGHVNDHAGVLSPGQVRSLEAELSQLRRAEQVHVAVLIVAGLEGETIEDLAYDTFNALGVGDAALDNGVLLVLAVAEQRVRIETGKGVGGELTDIESGRIIREQIKPRVVEGRWYEAATVGTRAIAAALTGVAGPRGPPPAAEHEPAPELTPLQMVLIGLAVLVIIVLAIIFPGFREVLFWVLFALLRRGGGGGGGGGSYRGGGGRSGGGGASG